MKTRTAILLRVVLLLANSACTSQPSTPTITSEDDRCQYSGPDSIQADQFAFQWVMKGQQFPDNSIFAIQVEEGHSVDDLIGLDGPISWISSLRYENNMQGGPWTKDIKWDLTESARFKPGRVYFLCTHLINGESVSYGVAGPVVAEGGK